MVSAMKRVETEQIRRREPSARTPTKWNVRGSTISPELTLLNCSASACVQIPMPNAA